MAGVSSGDIRGCPAADAAQLGALPGGVVDMGGGGEDDAGGRFGGGGRLEGGGGKAEGDEGGEALAEEFEVVELLSRGKRDG